MLSFSIIGTGAAGNKALIELMDMGYNKDKCYLMNSTYKDINKDVLSSIDKDHMLIFGESSNRLGGCGKERAIGRDMVLSDLKTNRLNLDSIVNPEDQAIILVGSTEGGSGSASLPILAKYFKQVHSKNVICILFVGFNDDVRGMKNTVDLFKEMSDEYTIIAISNSKFLDQSNNKFKAEEAANQEFCNIVKILTGATISAESSQMMDDTDLYKVVTTPGYMIAKEINFNRPKNIESYHKMLMETLTEKLGFVDPSKYPGAKRIAMIFDSPDMEDNVDYVGTDLREMYGEPFEFFTSLNPAASSYNVSFIVSGMKMPQEEITSIYDQYIDRTSRVDKEHDSFFDMMKDLDSDPDDRGFDMMVGVKKNVESTKNDFFNDFKEPHVDTVPDKSVAEKKANFEY